MNDLGNYTGSYSDRVVSIHYFHFQGRFHKTSPGFTVLSWCLCQMEPQAQSFLYFPAFLPVSEARMLSDCFSDNSITYPFANFSHSSSHIPAAPLSGPCDMCFPDPLPFGITAIPLQPSMHGLPHSGMTVFYTFVLYLSLNRLHSKWSM